MAQSESGQQIARMNSQSDLETLGGTNSNVAKPMEFKAFQINGNALYDRNCVTCGNENYEVTYHKQRHICDSCRKHLTTLEGEPAFVYMDNDGSIKCYIDKDKSKTEYLGKGYVRANHNELKIFGLRCYATFSGPDELILLLDDVQPMLQMLG